MFAIGLLMTTPAIVFCSDPDGLGGAFAHKRGRLVHELYRKSLRSLQKIQHTILKHLVTNRLHVFAVWNDESLCRRNQFR